MRTMKLITAMTAMLLAGTSWAGGPYRPAPQPVEFHDTARVVSSTPVYDEINQPRSECWTERVGYYDDGRGDRSYGGAILGAIIGGVAGNQFGKGSGRNAATAAGAAIGAITGDNIDNDGRYARGRGQPRLEERCRTVDNWTRQVVGYDVAYRYQGREYKTFLPFDPGPTLRLRVNVSVAERW